MSLRWSRPDLTAVLAQHLSEAAVAAADRDAWLVASGWRVNAAAAVGDGREAASEVLEALSHWGEDVLHDPAAGRLRLELGVLAHEAGVAAAAQALLAPPTTGPAATDDDELAADVALARLRCAADDELDDVETGLADVQQAWARVGGSRAEVGAASALLVCAAIERRAGRTPQAVAHTVDGLARLDRGRGPSGALTPSGHLAAALAAEWISALIDDGRPGQAAQGAGPLRARLVEHRRPTRQLALLRLTIARASASDPHGVQQSDPTEEVERAAEDAAASDTPDLEHVCRVALGELYESAGRLDAALESIRLAVVADRRHRSRASRFHAALISTEPLWRRGRDSTPLPPVSGETAAGRGASEGHRAAEDSATANGHGAERTAVLRTVRPTADGGTPPPSNGTAPGNGNRVAAPGNAAPGNAALGNAALGARGPDVAESGTPVAEPRRAPAADPWATGSWTVGAGGGEVSNGVWDRERADVDSRRGRTERAPSPRVQPGGVTVQDGTPEGSLAGDALFAGPEASAAEVHGVGSTQAPTADGGDTLADTADPGTWLAAALAELDRVWGVSPGRVADTSTATPPGASPTGAPGQAHSDGTSPGEEGATAGPAAGTTAESRYGTPARTAEASAPTTDAADWTAPTGTAAARETAPVTAAHTGHGGARRLRAAEAPGRGAAATDTALSDRSLSGAAGPGATGAAVAGAADATGAAITGTAVPGATGTAGPGATGVAVPGATGAAVPGATGAAVPGATGAAVPGATGSAVPGATGAAVPGAANATGTAATGAAVPGGSGAAVPGGTGAAVPGSTGAAVPGATGAAVTGATGVAASGAADITASGANGTSAGGPAACVVVLDLSRAGERLPTEAAAPTVARVAQRLADRLPPSSRLRDDGLGAVSVILPGRDRVAASDWMHRTLPGLVDGLAVDPAVAGALLRAAVHDADGVVGAQILQRLDGTPPRARPVPTRSTAPRHAAPSPDDAADGEPVRDVASTSAPGTPVERTHAERARAQADDGDHGIGSPREPAAAPEAPTGGRHDESAARPPYLPEGVVVRPGSGGRRHRRGPDPTAADPADASDLAPQSTEGLGLADLLAGALAAYRGI